MSPPRFWSSFLVGSPPFPNYNLEMPLRVWCQTDKGKRRQSNQDSYLIDESSGLFVVADGMGGHSGGEVASALAVKVAQETLGPSLASGKDVKELIHKAFLGASQKIYDKAHQESPELIGMGTTMVMLVVTPQKVFVGNVGDSRAYMCKRPYLWQLTEDHSLVNEQLRAGLIREDQVANFSAKNVITRSVGFERDVEPDILVRERKAGEIFVLCSDGLSGLVSDERISEILLQSQPEEMAQRCVQQALANGGDDNVTVMVVEIQ